VIGEQRILDSWKEISDYLKRDIRTCRRYERDLGMPVRRLEGASRARVFAYQDEIDVWLAKRLGGRPSLFPRILYFVSSKPLVALFLSVLIFGLGVGLDHCLSGRRETGTGRSALTIVVLPFHNTSARANLDKWMHGIPQLLMPSLSGSKYFSVFGYDRTLATLRELGIDPAKPYAADDLVRIKRRSGATHAVTGILIGAGDGVCIALATIKLGADEAFSSRFNCADEAAIVEAAGRIADQVKRDLGLTRTTQSDDFDAIGVPVTAASLEAFRLYNEGRRLHVAGDFEKSARIMRRALDLDPEFALAWRSLAASLANQGEKPAATDCFLKALEASRNATTQERFFIRSSYFQHKMEFGRALQISHEWASLYPDDTQALLFAGRAALSEEDAEGAHSALFEGLRKGDRNPFLFFYASLSCTAMGQFDEAAEVRERGLSIHPENSIITSAAMIDAVVRGQYDHALGELDRIRDKGPEAQPGLVSGDILLLKGDFRGAERSYANALPRSGHALTRLALLALAEGRYGRAAELAAQAENDGLLAYIESRRGQLSAGLESAAKAVKAAEEQSHRLELLVALVLKGEIEARSGDLDAARADAARIRTSSGGGLAKAHERAVRFLRGIIASAEGRGEEAVEAFEAMIGLLPKDVPYLDDFPRGIGVLANLQALFLHTAAVEIEKAGRPEAALELYLRLLALNGGRLQHPDLFALSHYAVGRIRQSEGDFQGAGESLTMFLSLWKDADPGLPEVEDAKRRLAAVVR